VLALLIDHKRVEADPTEGRDYHDVARTMQISEDDLRGVAGEYFWVDDQSGEASQVGIFRGSWNDQDPREIFFEVRFDVGQADPADLFNNRDVIGRRDLPASGETALKAVIV
jgi:hypothetical protein